MISYCTHQHAKPDLKAPAIVFDTVSAGYERQSFAIKQLSLQVPTGQCVALVGPNGAGKSTLFKVAANLLRPALGTVRIFGQPLGTCHHRVVYLPQRAEIDWQFPLSVIDFVATGRYVYKGWFSRLNQQDRDLAVQSLNEVQLADVAHKHLDQISGGQQQRVLIARALVQHADLLLLDEPLNAVDAATRDIVAALLSTLKKQGKTVVVATHYFDAEEKRYDAAIYLKDGMRVSPVRDAVDDTRCGCGP